MHTVIKNINIDLAYVISCPDYFMSWHNDIRYIVTALLSSTWFLPSRMCRRQWWCFVTYLICSAPQQTWRRCHTLCTPSERWASDCHLKPRLFVWIIFWKDSARNVHDSVSPWHHKYQNTMLQKLTVSVRVVSNPDPPSALQEERGIWVRTLRV